MNILRPLGDAAVGEAQYVRGIGRNATTDEPIASGLLTKRALEAFLTLPISVKENDLTAREIKHVRDTLRALRMWATREGIVPPPSSAPKPVWLNPANEADLLLLLELLAAVQGDELERPVTVLLFSDLRGDELLALKWRDLNLPTRTITVRRRVKMRGDQRCERPLLKPRSTSVDVVVELFQQQAREQMTRLRIGHDGEHGEQLQRNGYVFTRADGTPWNPDAFSSAFQQLLKRKHLPRITIKDV